MPPENIGLTSEYPSDEFLIVYDGECPFCSKYVQIARIRASVGTVRLINARDELDPVVQHLKRDGYDLNEGIAAIFGDVVYFGKDAIVIISILGDAGSVVSRALRALLRNKTTAAFLYPLLKLGRRATLAMLGRSLIQRH